SLLEIVNSKVEFMPIRGLWSSPGKIPNALSAQRFRMESDDLLILRKSLSKYQTRDPKLKPFQDLAGRVIREFRKLTLVHTPRAQNILANSLASLASSIPIPLGRSFEAVSVQRLKVPSHADLWFSQLKSPSFRVHALSKEPESILMMAILGTLTLKTISKMDPSQIMPPLLKDGPFAVSPSVTRL
ncbi:hypothetical protein Taro_045516, partial [Colocasia esculenta]|nr:hypothetical protein [Colocasia esculenta]